ncbi:SGNH/GDSL hydrolase family protein [Gammaproteobacteria bacterium]|nr:SGNH/GDSL hydrolase family protein [Gammaproteobacteria bacterium]
MSWIKTAILSSFIIILSIFIAILLVEGFLQIIKERDGWELTRSINVKRNFEFDYPVTDPYDSTIGSVNYKRDEHGLRDSCSDPKNIKILTIGGSTTDQRFVSPESTFQSVLQDRLNDKIGPFGCVSNAGVDGHSSHGHIYSFERWFPLISNLSPAYIIIYVGINDADFRRATTANPGHDNMYSEGWKGWLKQFEIVILLLPIFDYMQSLLNPDLAFTTHKPIPYSLNNYTEKNLNKDTIKLAEINALAFRERYELLLEYVEEMGAKPICVTQPHIFTKIINDERLGVANVINEYNGLDFDYSLKLLNSQIYDLCGPDTIDLYNYEFKKEHFYDGIHTTELGSTFIGNVMADFIIENNFHSSLTTK